MFFAGSVVQNFVSLGCFTLSECRVWAVKNSSFFGGMRRPSPKEVVFFQRFQLVSTVVIPRFEGDRLRL